MHNVLELRVGSHPPHVITGAHIITHAAAGPGLILCRRMPGWAETNGCPTTVDAALGDGDQVLINHPHPVGGEAVSNAQ